MNKKPKVKLLTLWMLDSKFDNYQTKPCEYNISKGIWETQGVEEREMKNSFTDRIYTLVCVSSYHPDLKIGAKRKMSEATIIKMCHRVKIVHLPKYKSIIK